MYAGVDFLGVSPGSSMKLRRYAGEDRRETYESSRDRSPARWQRAFDHSHHFEDGKVEIRAASRTGIPGRRSSHNQHGTALAKGFTGFLRRIALLSLTETRCFAANGAVSCGARGNAQGRRPPRGLER